MAGIPGIASAVVPAGPWWTMPESNRASDIIRTGGNTLSNFQRNAPPGYEYDPVQMRYVRTPTAAGQRLSQFQSAALGGLQQAVGGGGVFGSATSGGGGSAPPGSYGSADPQGWQTPGGAPTAGGRISSIGPIDMSAANAAIYGRAKDVAGQTGRASLDTLRAVLGETGQLGGGAESQGVRDIIENAAGQVGDVNREMAIQGGRQAFDVARTNQAAGITQRGQDIQAQEAQARLAQEQADIMFKQQMAKSQQQLDLLRMVLGQSGGGAGFMY